MKTDRQLHVSDLRDLRSCVDHVDCVCTDPPTDKGEDPEDYRVHSDYCPEYLLGYIDSLLAIVT